MRVVIAGGGVAGLEAVLALRALAADLVDITILAPELKFTNRSMSVAASFSPQRVRGFRLEAAIGELGARWHRGALDRVEPDRHRVVTKDGDEIVYDRLVLALGTHHDRVWHEQGVLTFDGRSHGDVRLLLDQLRHGRVSKVVFVKPTGASWLLPLYDLALLTAAECAGHELTDVQLSLVTPEEEPLGIFGRVVSDAIRGLLDDHGVELHTSSVGVPRGPGLLALSPGDRAMRVDRIVTEPRLIGPRLRGIPCGQDGFLNTDAHGRVIGVDDVFAAGDATDFPVKHGSLAAQQADTVAEAVAASAGANIDPLPFRPILRGVLLSGGPARFLRADISGDVVEDSTISQEPLWSPPNKLSGRYLAPYLSNLVGDASDVMPADDYAVITPEASR